LRRALCRDKISAEMPPSGMPSTSPTRVLRFSSPTWKADQRTGGDCSVCESTTEEMKV
jgi:hypothetical protein